MSECGEFPAPAQPMYPHEPSLDPAPVQDQAEELRSPKDGRMHPLPYHLHPHIVRTRRRIRRSWKLHNIATSHYRNSRCNVFPVRAGYICRTPSPAQLTYCLKRIGDPCLVSSESTPLRHDNGRYRSRRRRRFLQPADNFSLRSTDARYPRRVRPSPPGSPFALEASPTP